MKKAFVYGLLVALAITGCQAELEVLNPENNTEPEVITQEPSKVFTAIVDEDFNGETKTSLDGEGNVLWKMGDQVSIFAASTVNEQYQVSDDSDGKTAATLNKIPAGGFVAGGEIDNNVAFYPYASTAEVAKSGSNYVISEIELPATQTYAAGSFGNGVFPMATATSSTEDMNLKFKNVLGGLKLQLKGTSTITSITVTGNNNEILCGDAEVTTTYGGVPSISLSDASAKTVTLNCGAGVTLDSETATPFIIALPPMTMTGGFTVEVTDSEGKQMEIKTTKPQTITRSNLLKMPAVNYVGTNTNKPLTITSIGSTTVAIQKKGYPNSVTLEYRIDSEEWSSYTIGAGINLADGQSMQFRAGIEGNNGFSTGDYSYYYFSITGTGTVKASGSIMSLLDSDLAREDMPTYGFCRLFRDCSKLVNADNLRLPVATLSMRCYAAMFEYCTGLTSAPELPATTLADGCYASMFYSCTGLTSAPELPATTLAEGCYASMFYSCTGLTSAPELPATKLAQECYREMFGGCSSLTTAPELLATTLAPMCYCRMFEDCTSLTITPSELPATTLTESCYSGMFVNCTSLTTTPKLLAITLASECYSSMFGGCTKLTAAPELPATTLANGCYSAMFYGCTSLTTAPELPATTLAINCYAQMFQNCGNLNYITMLATDVSAYGCLYNWVDGVSATGTFVKSSSATWDEIGVNGVPSGWAVITD